MRSVLASLPFQTSRTLGGAIQLLNEILEKLSGDDNLNVEANKLRTQLSNLAVT